MSTREKIEELLEASKDGTISTSQVTEAGLHRGILQEYVKNGEMYRFGRGLYVLRGEECDKEILKEIRESDTLRKLWEKYRREYDYAKDISFEDTCNTVQEIMKAIML